MIGKEKLRAVQCFVRVVYVHCMKRRRRGQGVAVCAVSRKLVFRSLRFARRACSLTESGRVNLQDDGSKPEDRQDICIMLMPTRVLSLVSPSNFRPYGQWSIVCFCNGSFRKNN